MGTNLVSITALKLIEALLAQEKAKSLREICKIAGISLAKGSYYAKALERLGYVRRRPKLAVSDRRLVYLLAYAYPLRSIEFIGFDGLERPAIYTKKISDIGKGKNLNYAFTHIAATEIVYPYKFSNMVYFYGKNEDLEEWKKELRKVGIIESDKGSIRLLFSELNPFLGARNLLGVNIVSAPRLFADLWSSVEMESAKMIAQREVLLNNGHI